MSPGFWFVVLGAALHDLGKLPLRADDRARQIAREHCAAATPHVSFSACPSCQGEFRYLHAFLSWALSRDLVPPPWAERVAALAGAHHHPRGWEAKVVALADRLSALEREQQEDEPGTPCLRSVLTALELGASAVRPLFFPLRPLSRRVSELYPVPQEELSASAPAYLELWRGLEAALRQLRDCRSWREGEEEAYLDGLLACLQVYLWSVPAATYRDLGDISLFEHLRLTAALAAAIGRQEPSEEGLDRALEGGEALGAIAFDLVAGDVSGVQDFLYTLTSRAVARGLRGRSSYLDMVSELAARWLLKEVGLPSCNLVYSGGARFYLLCHPLEEGVFNALRARLAGEFLERFEGRLYLALARTRVTAQELRAEAGWATAVRGLEGALADAKARRFSELGAEAMARKVFVPAGGGALEQVCAVCGREGADIPLEEGRAQCRACAGLAELGRRLADARALAALPARGKADGLWPLFGHRLEALAGPGQLPGREPPSWLWVDMDVGALREAFDALSGGERPPSLLLRFIRLVTPRRGPEDEAIADFESLATASCGDDLLGLVKMDVDDLGEVFGRGLGGRGSPSRWATLSFLLRLFFEGRVAELASELESGAAADPPLRVAVSGALPAADERPRHLYVIYSGGDDLLAVGSWDLVVELALRIREEFGRFSGSPSLTASAGVHLADYGLPLYQMVREAQEGLERAKARRDGNGRQVKDGVTFLGETFSWPELQETKEVARRLLQLLIKKEVPRSLLYRLMAFYGMERADRGRLRRMTDRPHYGRWLWLTAYFLARLAEQHRTAAKDLRSMAAELDARPERLGRYAYAARWAELLSRERRR